jgi:pimeloyl-ACP methyl ester carboxylesterase
MSGGPIDTRFARITIGVAITATLAAAVSVIPPRAVAVGENATPTHGNFAGQIGIGGGRKLWLRCRGKGRPAVILESGIHDSSDTWKLSAAQPPVVAPAVFPGVARFARVCRYDRPGTIRYTDPPALTMRSTPVPMPRTLPGMASDLRTLLKRAGIRGPYVLVGHSFGGMIARLFAQAYPRKAAGLALVDSFNTNIRELFGDLWPQYRELLNHPGTPLDSQPSWETFDIDGAIDAVLAAPALPALPLAVMSKTEPFAISPAVSPAIQARLEGVWPAVQDALVPLEPRTPHILATGSDHYVQVSDPDLTIATIRLIVDRARRGR